MNSAQSIGQVKTLDPSPTLLTVKQFCEIEPGFTQGGLRHLLFIKGEVPGVYRFGRKILIDRAEFMAYVRSGQASVIGGRSK